MESNVAGEFLLHRKSRSSERFLGLFSQSNGAKGDSAALEGGDLDERDVFWSGRDFSYSANRGSGQSPSASAAPAGFRRPENFGILAALAEDGTNRVLGGRDPHFLSRKPSAAASPSSASRMIPAIPKPQAPLEYSQSVPVGKFLQSEPVDVPVMARMNSGRDSGTLEAVGGGDSDEEMLPPHEIVARSSACSPLTTFSVLEGRGRTLKGRDLRQVRNAVWRKTGFLD